MPKMSEVKKSSARKILVPKKEVKKNEEISATPKITPVKPKGPIAILCHWRTGSSVLAKVLRACGMIIGNEQTLWDSITCENQCEHSLMNQAGDQISLGNNLEKNKVLAKSILLAYKAEATKHGWDNYGLKFTHALQATCWAELKAIFEECWPDARYVISRRSVEQIIAAMNDPNWPEQKIKDSYTSCEAAVNYLVKEKGAFIINYPDDHSSGEIKKVVEALGLTWTKEAEGVFSK